MPSVQLHRDDVVKACEHLIGEMEKLRQSTLSGFALYLRSRSRPLWSWLFYVYYEVSTLEEAQSTASMRLLAYSEAPEGSWRRIFQLASPEYVYHVRWAMILQKLRVAQELCAACRLAAAYGVTHVSVSLEEAYSVGMAYVVPQAPANGGA